MQVEKIYKRKTNILVTDALDLLELYDIKTYCKDKFGEIKIGMSTILYCRCTKGSNVKVESFTGGSNDSIFKSDSGVIIIADEDTVDKISDFFPDGGIFVKGFTGEISFDGMGRMVGDMAISFPS